MEVRGAGGIPEEARLQSSQGTVVDRRKRLQQAVRDGRECATDMRDDVVYVREVKDCLRYGKVLEYARCFEVELDVASRVGRWVCFDQQAVHAQVRGRGVDVDDLIGAARVHSLEEGREGGITKVATLEVGVERDTYGSKRVERICGFSDGVLGVWERDDAVEREAIWVDLHVRRRLLIDQPSKRDCRSSITGIRVCAGRGEGHDCVRDALACHEVEVPTDVPKRCRVPAGRWSDCAIPVGNAMRYQNSSGRALYVGGERHTMNVDDGGNIGAASLSQLLFLVIEVCGGDTVKSRA